MTDYEKKIGDHPGKIRSWLYIRDDFRESFQKLQESGCLEKKDENNLLWQTSEKYVMKIPVGNPEHVVYKTYVKIKNQRKFLFRYSPSGKEAENIQLFAKHGFPMVKLLASGDVRTFFFLKKSFIMTEFAEGFRDGRDFFTGENNDPEQCFEFIRRNLILLAKCHDLRIWHKGFTPANLLYSVKKGSGTPSGFELDLRWIDVATCKKMRMHFPFGCRVDDLCQFFRFFSFSDNELLEFLKIYCEHSERESVSPETLFSKLHPVLMKKSAKFREKLARINR